MSSSRGPPGLPAILEPSTALRVGQARIERLESGAVEACDPYGCQRIEVRRNVEVRVLPAPASRRLLQVSHIYIEFETPLHASDGETVWFYAPIELDVIVGGIPALRLAPIPVKYTLVGDVVDGVICRYYKSPARPGKPFEDAPPGTALVAMRLSGGHAILPGGGVGAASARLYRDSRGLLYYSLQRLEVEGANATLRPTQNPPLEGLREVRRPARRVPRLQQALQQLNIKLPHLGVE